VADRWGISMTISFDDEKPIVLAEHEDDAT
jgi:hypothetical protein